MGLGHEEEVTRDMAGHHDELAVVSEKGKRQLGGSSANGVGRGYSPSFTAFFSP